jgi:2-amino-4-hydroxy-6-hydroxymethyldihydropteridine diphosphokinase
MTSTTALATPTPPVRVFVAAGSNVNPAANLQRALANLGRHYALQRSSVYRNKAVGFDGDDFINLVIGFVTTDSLDQVVTHLHAAEAECGRPRDAAKWAPRTMDLDLLLYGNMVSDQQGRKLPRPDLLKRPYMLRPLAELAPELIHPTVGKPMRQIWAEWQGDPHDMVAVAL